MLPLFHNLTTADLKWPLTITIKKKVLELSRKNYTAEIHTVTDVSTDTQLNDLKLLWLLQGIVFLLYFHMENTQAMTKHN